jgi:hypothetical protein
MLAVKFKTYEMWRNFGENIMLTGQALFRQSRLFRDIKS